jgi:cytochrome P450
MSRVVSVRSSRIRNFLAFQRTPLQFMVEMLHEGDVVSLRTSSTKPSYVVNSPEFIQEILVTKDQAFRKGRSSDILRRTIGDGLLTSEGEQHRKQRKYMQPSFYKERIQAYAEIVREETQRLGSRLSSGQMLSMHEEMMQLTLNIITRTMFATDVADNKVELAAAVNVTIEQTARTLFSPIVLPISIPTPRHVKHKRAIRTLEEMVITTIRDAKQRPEAYTMTLLGLLLDTQDEQGNSLSESEIRDQMMTMLLAGHETTANLLTWVWVLLDKHPGIYLRFQEEIDAIHKTELSAYEFYRSMEFTQRIIQETLRLYPPAWMILREAQEEVELLGETFPMGSTFLISPYAIHRNGNVFEDPEAFRPERFLDGGPSRWPKFAYFPFGGGSRSCIGSQFAMMEALLIMSELARQFSFHRVTEQPIQPEPLVSLRVKDGVIMTVKARHS